MSSMVLGNTIFFKARQLLKALSPIVVHPLGIIMFSRALQQKYMYMFEYQLFVVNTVEKWLNF